MKFYKYKGETHSVTHILLENLEEIKLFLRDKDIFGNRILITILG